MSRDTFGCSNLGGQWDKEKGVVVSSGWRSGILLNSLQCTATLPLKELLGPKYP